MSTTTTSPIHPAPLVSTSSKNRAFIILTAFWEIMRRDIVVTGREFISFLLQVLVQPLFLLFVFGKVLPSIGATQQVFSAFFLPGIVALTLVITAVQSVTLSLALDLGYSREIDDRLLAPLPVSMVAVEKVLFAVMRSMVAGVLIFPLAYWILGNGYQVRTDALVPLVGIMLLAAFASAAMGLTLGTVVQGSQINLVFTLVFAPLIFTGCVYFPWSGLDSLKWFQIVTLFNPLTYASEGLRYAMVPPFHGHPFPTLAIGWVLLGLGTACGVFLLIGIQSFRRRVVS